MKTFFICLTCLILSCLATIVLLTHPLTRKPELPQMTKKQQPSPTPTPYSLEIPPSQALIGMITSLSGDVSWESRIATEPATTTTLTQVKQGESIHTGETGNVTLALSDLTLTIFSQTLLEFSQTLPTSIVLAQKKGTVAYQMTSATPISIRSLHTLIKLSPGVSTTIFVDDEEGLLEVSVSTGSVTIAFNDSENISTILTIPKGNQLTFADKSRTTTMEEL